MAVGDYSFSALGPLDTRVQDAFPIIEGLTEGLTFGSYANAPNVYLRLTFTTNDVRTLTSPSLADVPYESLVDPKWKPTASVIIDGLTVQITQFDFLRVTVPEPPLGLLMFFGSGLICALSKRAPSRWLPRSRPFPAH